MSVEAANADVLLEYPQKLEAQDPAAEEQEASRIIHTLLQGIPPELIASFEPGATEALYESSRANAKQQAIDDLMHTSFIERAEALTTERAELLVELQQYRPGTDEQLIEAMKDPAVYFKEAMIAFNLRCAGRLCGGDTHRIGGTNQVQFSNYFATAKERRSGERPRYLAEPELFMRIGYSYDEKNPKYRDEQGQPLGEPRFFEARTAFRRDEFHPGNMFEFYVGADNQLKITEIYFSRGNYHRAVIEDKARSYQLFQALVMDMHYELEFYDETRDEEVQAMTRWYILNQVGVV